MPECEDAETLVSKDIWSLSLRGICILDITRAFAFAAHDTP